VTLQPNTQKKVGLNCLKINKQPISLVEPKDRIGLVCIVQENALAADLNQARYLTGEEQRDYPRPNGYGKKYRRYLADRVRASKRIFSLKRYGPRTQNCCSQNNRFVQNDRKNNGFAQNNRKYSTNRVRASQTIFSSTINLFKE